MAKHTPQATYLSQQGNKLTVSPNFVYEVSLYQIYKDRVEGVGNQFYAFDKPFTSKEVIAKKYQDSVVVKFFTWLSAPLDYLVENNFKLINDEDNPKRVRGSERNKPSEKRERKPKEPKWYPTPIPRELLR